MKEYRTKAGPLFYYLGPDVDEGPLPAFFYFALHGKDSLGLPPYNRPIELLPLASLRVFSVTLPLHEERQSHQKTIANWIEALSNSDEFLSNFLSSTIEGIDELISNNIVFPNKLAFGGLSRGAWVAFQLASRERSCHTVLGFAPLTKMSRFKVSPHFQGSEEQLRKWDLLNLSSSLIQLRHVRLYCGNKDETVGTDTCFEFYKSMVDLAAEKKVRSFDAELIFYPSIGLKGHGTPSNRFDDGAAWISHHLIGGPYAY